MSIAKRVDQLINHYNMSYNSFAKSIGMSNGTAIKKMVDYDRNPQNKTLNRICETYPKISYDWLRTGEGAMSKIKTNEIGGLPESMSGDDDLTVTAKQVISQLDINNKHYTAILDKKMRDDRDYYDNDSKHVKNIAKILEGFKSLEEKVEHYAESASTKVVDMMLKGMEEQNKMLLNGLKKIQTLETDLEDIKTFMAANFELDKMKKKKAKQIKKLTPR